MKNNLKFLSILTNRTQASITSSFLKEKVTMQANRMRALQEAKTEAQKGIFTSQEAMELWVNSLGTENELPMPKADIFSDPVLL